MATAGDLFVDSSLPRTKYTSEMLLLSQIGVCLLLEWSSTASAFVIDYMLEVSTYTRSLWVHRLQSVCKFVLVLGAVK
jgi:hypothetical protein